MMNAPLSVRRGASAGLDVCCAGLPGCCPGPCGWLSGLLLRRRLGRLRRSGGGKNSRRGRLRRKRGGGGEHGQDQPDIERRRMIFLSGSCLAPSWARSAGGLFGLVQLRLLLVPLPHAERALALETDGVAILGGLDAGAIARPPCAAVAPRICLPGARRRTASCGRSTSCPADRYSGIAVGVASRRPRESPSVSSRRWLWPWRRPAACRLFLVLAAAAVSARVDPNAKNSFIIISLSFLFTGSQGRSCRTAWCVTTFLNRNHRAVRRNCRWAGTPWSRSRVSSPGPRLRLWPPGAARPPAGAAAAAARRRGRRVVHHRAGRRAVAPLKVHCKSDLTGIDVHQLELADGVPRFQRFFRHSGLFHQERHAVRRRDSSAVIAGQLRHRRGRRRRRRLPPARSGSRDGMEQDLLATSLYPEGQSRRIVGSGTEDGGGGGGHGAAQGGSRAFSPPDTRCAIARRRKLPRPASTAFKAHSLRFTAAPRLLLSASFLETTPERVNRTWIVFFLSGPPVIWISLVESSSGSLARAARRFTSCSIRQVKRTVTEASP